MPIEVIACQRIASHVSPFSLSYIYYHTYHALSNCVLSTGCVLSLPEFAVFLGIDMPLGNVLYELPGFPDVKKVAVECYNTPGCVAFTVTKRQIRLR